jgi:lipopolysaccharide export LptBFGC system permease protein LptF
VVFNSEFWLNRTACCPKICQNLLTDASNQRIALAAFDANKSAAGDKVARPSTWKSIAQWPALDLPYASYLSDHVRLDPYITLQGSVSLGFFAIVTTCLSVIACVRKGRVTEAATVALSILLFGTLVYGVNTVCIFYLHRYALPLFAAVIVALFASLTALGENGFRQIGS